MYTKPNKYLEMLSPENLIEELGSGIELENYFKTLGKDDLIIQLNEFEKSELYEHCITINNILQSKINNITVSHFTEL
jgi:hypothetical protein